MLSKRIIACLPVLNGIVVQSIEFKKYLPICKPEIAIEFLNSWGIDEIIYLDISATKKQGAIDSTTIHKVVEKCFVPFTVGGGIQSVSQVAELMENGADKVSVNHIALQNPKIISEIANKFGSQAIVASIDAILIDNNYYVFDYVLKNYIKTTVQEQAKKYTDFGAGELLINSVHKDGTYSGYDIDLVKEISNLVSIPVIALGGAGSPVHLKELFLKTDVSAAAVGNYFHFYEHSVTLTKKFLKESHLPIRLETYINYSHSHLDDFCRLEKKTDESLEALRFFKIEKEII